VSYAIEWIAAPVFLGSVLLLLIGPIALIAVIVAATAALAALLAVAGAVLAMPYLLVRALRRRLAERRQSAEGTGPIARAIAQAGWATRQSGVAILTNSTTARRSP
jgi:hypothetical protein